MEAADVDAACGVSNSAPRMEIRVALLLGTVWLSIDPTWSSVKYPL